MMGNPMKNERVFELATAAGISPDQLSGERMHAPIGIPLGDKTPVGLAVSIMAEIIKVKYDRTHQNVTD
jgi:xanthine/CO dehydrogenase XdhC/CoxF family maturation factor